MVLELWDYLARSYQVEAGLDNSTVLAPLDGEASNFVIISRARWDGNLARLRLGPPRSVVGFVV